MGKMGCLPKTAMSEGALAAGPDGCWLAEAFAKWPIYLCRLPEADSETG
jgi:hypothetical protein